MTDNRFPDVMVLAAGLGRRLRPLTENTPKPLIRIAGTPLIDRVIANAHAEGATRFVVNAHHHADQIKVHIAALEALANQTENNRVALGAPWFHVGDPESAVQAEELLVQ